SFHLRCPLISTFFPYTTLFRSRLSMVAGGIFFLLTAAYISFWNIDLRVRSGYFQEADYILSFNSEFLNSSGTELIEYQEQNVFRSEEHTSELQSRFDLVCRLLL